MTDLDLEYYSRLLQQEKDSLLSFMAQEGMGKHVSLKDSIEELSLIDNHPADQLGLEHSRIYRCMKNG